MPSQQLDYSVRSVQRRLSPRVILVAITAVAAVVVVVVVFLIVAAGDLRTPSEYSLAVRQIQSLSASIDFFTQDVQRPPTTTEGLGALLTAPAGAAGWNGPYADAAEIARNDPWGNPILYRATAKGFLIQSAGPDAVVGTEDDVSNRPRAATRASAATQP